MSIVAMKKKMEAKRGLSSGGKGFSLNPKVKCSNVNSATVKSARQARQNLVKRAVCFSGSEGILCERVWDGKRAPDCMGSGDSMTQEEYIEKKRTSAASCKNVLLNFTNTQPNITTVIVEYNTLKQIYEIEFNGNKYQVDWNHVNKYIGDVISTIGAVEFDNAGGGSTQCLLPTSVLNIVEDVNGGGNKYVFNGETTYNSDLSFGLFDGNYTILDVPRAHPIALVNNSKESLINWTIDDSSPIIINVAGGTDQPNAVGDYFIFTDAAGNPLEIGSNNINSLKFMRDRTYRFVNNGINTGYGFVFYMGPGNPSELLGTSGISTNNITNVSSTSAVSVINGNQYRLNGASGTTDISYGMTNGTYKLTGIPQANPLGIVSGAGLTYSVDDSVGHIVINVAGGNDSPNIYGDHYTFTDAGGNAINLGDDTFKFMRGRSYRFVDAGITDGHQFKLYANGGVSDGLGNSVATTLAAGCLPQGDNTITTNGSNYELSAYNVYTGSYRFTGIPQSDPIAFLNNNFALDYNVDDGGDAIVITVTGGSTTANGAGDYYTFTVDGQAVNIANGDFKFMRGRSYRFQVGAAGITDGHQFKLYANGGISANGLGNSASSTLPAGCLPEGDNTITTNGSNYELSAYNVFDGVYRFTGIPESDPIAFLNAGVPNFNYNVDDSTPIVINVAGGSTGANGAGDYYTFTVDGQAVNIANGDFKFMRGKTYRFEADGIGGSHPFKLYHNNTFVTASNGGNSISGTGDSITVNILPDHPFPITSGDMLYYQCGVHANMKADLGLSMLDVGGVGYDFFYGTIEVTISGTFTGPVGFRNLAGGITSASGLSYSSTCQVGTGDGVTQIDVTIGADHSILAGNLYYVHQDAGVADVNMTLTTLDVGGVVYDFYYGNIIVLIDNAFNGQGTVTFRNFADTITSGANGLTYSDTCQVGTGDGVSEINVTIGAGHGTGAGDLKYSHQTAANDVNMSLTAIDVGGGAIVDHFYGNIDVVVSGDFGDANVRNLDGNFVDGENLITYGQSSTNTVPGVSTLDINIPSNNLSLTGSGALYYEKRKNGAKTDTTGGATYNPVNTRLLYKTVGGNSYDFYYGNLNMVVNGDFGDVSVECYYHGAMGGTNLLTYTDKCDINLSGTADANGPATLVVRSFSNTEPRTVELAKEADTPVVLSFKNPEAFIFEPVGCNALSSGSGLGGTSGADNRGYYGRGRCKVHYVNKSPQFQPKTYTGTGGYLDKLKRPNTDISFCG